MNRTSHYFFVCCQGETTRTFDEYLDVQKHVSGLYPEGQYRPWAKSFDGRMWREVRMADECVLSIGTCLSVSDLMRIGAE